MVLKIPKHLEKYAALFEKHMRHVDPVMQTVLTGHLIVESAIDNILELMFVNPKYLKAARLPFAQKVRLARGFALRKSELESWALILSINEVRNEMSHNLDGEKRTQKMEQLKRLYLLGAGEAAKALLEDAPDEMYAYSACLECVGFLGTMEDDMKELRSHIDTLDEVLNPDLERVRPKE